MAQDESKGIAGWWHGLKNKASQVVGDQQADFAHGKVAGVTVTDDAGNVLVEAGQRITDEVLAQAKRTGKIPALAASAMKGQGQDLKEQVQTQYARTDSAQEARLLDTVEEYSQSRRYLGRVLTMDVTDIRGNIIVPSGKTLEEEDVRRARDAGQIGAFLAAAEQSLPGSSDTTPSPPPLFAPSAPRPAARLLNDPDEK